MKFYAKRKKEKERKRKERLEKKKERDEVAKRKAEERAKKAEEKSKKVQERSKKAVRPQRKPNTSTRETSARVTEDASSHSSMTAVSSFSNPIHAVVSDTHSTDTIVAATGAGGDDNVCCECYATFEEDIAMGNQAEWTRCGCKRWMHVDCISEIVIHSDGSHRMCSNCVV